MVCAGCLTVDRKEIYLKVNANNSGSGRIVFYDIASIDEEGRDASLTDYTQLVNNYLKGTKFEEFYPQYTNFRKRLYEENGRLCGEITFDFEHYEDVGLYRYQNKGPWMYHVGAKTDFVVERYDTSNGMFANETMPVVFWPDSLREFRINTRFDRSDLVGRSLLPLYKRIGIE